VTAEVISISIKYIGTKQQLVDECCEALNFDYFSVMSLRIYNRNDYDRISLLNRGGGGFRCFFTAE
jgi:hypothetical protein